MCLNALNNENETNNYCYFWPLIDYLTFEFDETDNKSIKTIKTDIKQNFNVSKLTNFGEKKIFPKKLR